MTDETVDLKKLVDSYIWQVNDVEKALTRLAQDAEELTREVQEHEQARKASQEQRDALERQRASLQGERENLMGAHAEATFTQNTAEIQRISRRRVALDEELTEVNQNIRECVNQSEDTDHARRAAELTVTKDELEKRLPKKTYEMAINNPLLESISKTIRADAERLRKQWNSISLPGASKEAMEEVRQQRGVKATKDSAWLVEQERKRQERMERFKNVAGNTDAVAAAMSRPKRKTPQPSVTATTDADGRLSGDTIRAALAAKQST